MPQLFTCPSCNASLDAEADQNSVRCAYCGHTVIVPKQAFWERADSPDAAGKKRRPQIVVGDPASDPKRPAGQIKIYRQRTSRTGCVLQSILWLTMLFFFCVFPLFFIIPFFPQMTFLAEEWAPLGTVVAGAGVQPAGPNGFGGEGTGPGRFQDARWVGVAGNGEVYVADYSAGRVQRFDAGGQYLGGWMTEGTTPLQDLAVDRAGNVYVVRDSAIQKYEGAAGRLLSPYAAEDRFDKIAAYPNGGLMGFSRHNFADHLVRLDDDGLVVDRFPEAISGQVGGNVLSVKSLAVDGLGNIYALPTFEDSVFKFAPDGRFLNRFGSAGGGPGQFRAPMALAVDGRSQVYVSDFKGIQVFDDNGRYLRLITLPPGHVAFGMAFNDQDTLYVASRTRVFIFPAADN